MATISAKWIYQPRKKWTCTDCERGIVGPVLRMYGCAETGDSPYVLRACIECATNSPDEKIMKAVSVLDAAYKEGVGDE